MPRSLIDATVAAAMSLAGSRGGGAVASGLARLPAACRAAGAAVALVGVLLGVAALTGLRGSAGRPPAPSPAGRLVRPSLDGPLGPAPGRPEIATIDPPVGTPIATFRPNIALQPDGKFLVASAVSMPGGEPDRYILARYRPDGAPDATFGEGGYVRAGFDAQQNTCSRVRAAVQPDGKILLAAAARVPGASSHVVGVQRFGPDGATDPTFGADGIAVLKVALPPHYGRRFGPYDGLCGLALLPDGKILLGGMGYYEVGRVFLVRLRPDGALDEGFGDGGQVTTAAPRQGPWHSPTDATEACDLALGPGGRIALAGTHHDNMHLASNLALVVFDASGRLDPAFGDGGWVVFDFWRHRDREQSSADEAHAVAFAPDGALLVAGSTTAYGLLLGEKLALARFDRTGRLDPHFGDGGVAFVGLWGRARALALQPDGMILVGGRGVPIDDRRDNIHHRLRDEGAFVLARFRPDGTPDPGFGEAGLIRVDHSSAAEVEDLVLQPDGRILAVGHGTVGSFDAKSSLVLIRHRWR